VTTGCHAPILALLLVPLALLVSGCADANVVEAAERRAIYRRADAILATGLLASPAEPPADEAVHSMAPLLVQDLGGASAPTAADTPGRLRSVEPGRTVVEPGEPTVYHATSTTTIGGRPYTTWTYRWWYPSTDERDAIARGIRMTVDDAGFPFVWEVLGDSSGARPIFVATALDAAASKRLGPPPDGRAFAVERPVPERPDVVVPGLLEPGPVPLGPFVYLTPDEHDVGALICRCMPSRVERIVESTTYRLKPLDATEVAGLPQRLRPSSDNGSLETALRLAAPVW